MCRTQNTGTFPAGRIRVCLLRVYWHLHGMSFKDRCAFATQIYKGWGGGKHRQKSSINQLTKRGIAGCVPGEGPAETEWETEAQTTERASHQHRNTVLIQSASGPNTDHSLVQLNETHCRVRPPKMDRPWWRVLTKRGPLEKGMSSHFSTLALRAPWIGK